MPILCGERGRRRVPNAASTRRPARPRFARLHPAAVDRREAELLRRPVHHVRRRSHRRRTTAAVGTGRLEPGRGRASGGQRRDTTSAEDNRGQDGVVGPSARDRRRVETRCRRDRSSPAPSLPRHHRRQLTSHSSSHSHLLASITLDTFSTASPSKN